MRGSFRAVGSLTGLVETFIQRVTAAAARGAVGEDDGAQDAVADRRVNEELIERQPQFGAIWNLGNIRFTPFSWIQLAAVLQRVISAN